MPRARKKKRRTPSAARESLPTHLPRRPLVELPAEALQPEGIVLRVRQPNVAPDSRLHVGSDFVVDALKEASVPPTLEAQEAYIAGRLDERGGRRWPSRDDRRYLDYVKRQPCCSSGLLGCDPHHYPAKGMGGANGDDRRTVPLARPAHDFLHDRGQLPGLTPVETKLHLVGTQLRLVLAYLDGRDHA